MCNKQFYDLVIPTCKADYEERIKLYHKYKKEHHAQEWGKGLSKLDLRQFQKQWSLRINTMEGEGETEDLWDENKVYLGN